ncbi:heptaprenyl diphosphate synthase component 1 [Aquibacillus koreensis]|uniref:Heptaprenyl diphosphate synthase component 1 n=1 Tax=Aquibacillus koreensis TaxID=279446 RepID=A0A9X3WFG8_9BACI|nr:heptaprenyl diphosphate synthase component 1 [Aquibacillus koreensis]MCT2537389.1 heptaprenyl diphosphate synthase component 1 [Aquibacillus koreensis]MDC3418835.1 heptaprenyl diphosphate synthase component 1 [Aquibacillus koreensis]
MKSSDILTVKEIKIELENRLKHSYLERFIQKPVIDEDKLFILFSIIKNTSYSDIQKQNYIITTMLVQIALDTHDLVTENNATNNTDLARKERQLTVLAGDYYSGLYYYLLSKIEDIPMIHTLATAIKEINELKMSIYYKEFDSVHEFMELLKKLESLLILRVSEHFDRSSANEFAGNWLLTRKLIREKDSFITKGNSPIFNLLTDGPAHKIQHKQIVNTVENYIQNYLERAEETISNLPFHFHSLKKHVNAIIYDNFGRNVTVMEEG